jgi:hypothetical protein
MDTEDFATVGQGACSPRDTSAADDNWTVFKSCRLSAPRPAGRTVTDPATDTMNVQQSSGAPTCPEPTRMLTTALHTSRRVITFKSRHLCETSHDTTDSHELEAIETSTVLLTVANYLHHKPIRSSVPKIRLSSTPNPYRTPPGMGNHVTNNRPAHRHRKCQPPRRRTCFARRRREGPPGQRRPGQPPPRAREATDHHRIRVLPPGEPERRTGPPRTHGIRPVTLNVAPVVA